MTHKILRIPWLTVIVQLPWITFHELMHKPTAPMVTSSAQGQMPIPHHWGRSVSGFLVPSLFFSLSCLLCCLSLSLPFIFLPNLWTLSCFLSPPFSSCLFPTFNSYFICQIKKETLVWYQSSIRCRGQDCMPAPGAGGVSFLLDAGWEASSHESNERKIHKHQTVRGWVKSDWEAREKHLRQVGRRL